MMEEFSEELKSFMVDLYPIFEQVLTEKLFEKETNLEHENEIITKPHVM